EPERGYEALRERLRRVDAVLFTHGHADHVLGLDEMRRFNQRKRARIPCYGDSQTMGEIRRTFAYIFDRDTPAGGGLAEIDLHAMEGPMALGGVTIVPVPLLHGQRRVFGYRMGSLAYLTDVSEIPDPSWSL